MLDPGVTGKQHRQPIACQEYAASNDNAHQNTPLQGPEKHISRHSSIALYDIVSSIARPRIKSILTGSLMPQDLIDRDKLTIILPYQIHLQGLLCVLCFIQKEATKVLKAATVNRQNRPVQDGQRRQLTLPK